MLKTRGSGILLHITSLPSPFGIGDLGPEAYKFADFLSKAGQTFWQILPLNPTNQSSAHSPYSSASAFAGDPLLISPELLVQDGLLNEEEITFEPIFCQETVDYETVSQLKETLLDKAYARFLNLDSKTDYNNFKAQNYYWIEDYALFQALKTHYGASVRWQEWSSELKNREATTLQKYREKLAQEIDRECVYQYLFFKQWQDLKTYCNKKQIQIIGDLPIYVCYDSVDVWSNPELFKLDEDKSPQYVAGVPPDYFSKTGQLWGNPVYDWQNLQQNNYRWWIQRIEHNFKLYNLFRIDHFRGMVGFWEVPAGEDTALNGYWVDAPSYDFFNTLLKRFLYLPIIAEDLGEITPDVREVMSYFEFPGMKVLLFAFDEENPKHPYLPYNFPRNSVAYTGTHDTNTIRGWFDNESTQNAKSRLYNYLGRKVSTSEIHWELIRMAMMSVANLVIIPAQDLLGLPESARMNIPGSSTGNWQWRILKEQLQPELANSLYEMTKTYGRV